MQALRLSVNSPGLSSIFKDWQIKVLALVPNGDCEPLGTKYFWEKANEDLREEFSDVSLSISRASVINFMTYLHKLDLLVGVLGTGKGGKRYNYTYQVDRDHFNDHVSRMLIESLVKEYPDVNMLMLSRVAMHEIQN